MSRDRFRAGKRLWSKADDTTLRRIYPDEPNTAIARRLRRTVFAIYGRAAKLGLHKSAAYMASPHAYRFRRGQGGGEAFRYPKGHVPANKGLRRPGWSKGRMTDTQFKPGIPSWRTMPIGSTRLSKEGYVLVKVADVPKVGQNVNWKALHIIEWERANGRPLDSRRECLWFTDGDRLNVDLANLELHTRAENMARNTMWRIYPRPLAEAVQLLGALNRQVRRRTREEQDRRLAESSL